MMDHRFTHKVLDQDDSRATLDLRREESIFYFLAKKKIKKEEKKCKTDQDRSVPLNSTVVPQFTNAFVCEQFGSEKKVFGNILFLFGNSTLDDKHDCGHLSYTNVAIFPKIMKQIKSTN